MNRRLKHENKELKDKLDASSHHTVPTVHADAGILEELSLRKEELHSAYSRIAVLETQLRETEAALAASEVHCKTLADSSAQERELALQRELVVAVTEKSEVEENMIDVLTKSSQTLKARCESMQREIHILTETKHHEAENVRELHRIIENLKTENHTLNQGLTKTRADYIDLKSELFEMNNSRKDLEELVSRLSETVQEFSAEENEIPTAPVGGHRPVSIEISRRQSKVTRRASVKRSVASPLTASVTEWIRLDNGDVAFVLAVRNNSDEWSAIRTYNDFKTLRANLVDVCVGQGLNSVFKCSKLVC